MESHLLNHLKSQFKAHRHGGKFLHSLPSKSMLPSMISDNLMCLAKIIPRQSTHTPYLLCPETQVSALTRQSILSHGEHLIPGSFQGHFRVRKEFLEDDQPG